MSLHSRTIDCGTPATPSTPNVGVSNDKNDHKQLSEQTRYGRALIKRCMAMGYSFEIASKAVMNLERSGKQRPGEDIISTRSKPKAAKPGTETLGSAKSMASNATMRQQIVEHFTRTKTEATATGISKVLGISAYSAKNIIEHMAQEGILTSRICATYLVYSLTGVQCAKFKAGQGGNRRTNIKGCEIDNIKFASIRKAEQHFDVSYKTITKWAKTGKSTPIDRTRYPRDTQQVQPAAQLEVIA
jgi:hypothetical protein